MFISNIMTSYIITNRKAIFLLENKTNNKGLYRQLFIDLLDQNHIFKN